MKKFGLICAGFLLISGTVYAGAKTVKLDQPKFGFTIQVPSDWKVEDSNYPDGSELWLSVPAGGDKYISCCFRPLKGDYDKAKSDIPASFRSENFAGFDENYGAENLVIKVLKKAACSKSAGGKIEICAAEFRYDYQEYPDQNAYYAIFKTGKGAYMAFFSSDATTYRKKLPLFRKVISSLKLLK